MNKGYRAFLLGTAQDQLPVRGLWLTIHRRDDEEPAAGETGVKAAAGHVSGVVKVEDGKISGRTAG